jgi:hypothetical protein
MAKTWVLDSETKGTGAHIAPLNNEPASASAKPLALVTLPRAPSPAKAPEPSHSRRFRVVDVMGARVLGENIGARETVGLLAPMRSPLDARVYVWVEKLDRWRLLTLGETRALWGMGSDAAADPARSAPTR